MGQKLGEARPEVVDLSGWVLKIEPDEALVNVAGLPLVLGLVKLKEADVVLVQYEQQGSSMSTL